MPQDFTCGICLLKTTKTIGVPWKTNGFQPSIGKRQIEG